MIHIGQFRTRVVQPVLQTLAGWTAEMPPAAENLLVGTAAEWMANDQKYVTAP